MLYFLANTILLMFFIITLAFASSTSAEEIDSKGFKISSLKDSLERNISAKLERDDLKVKNVSVKRADSNKSFSLSDLKNVKIRSRFSLKKLDINNDNNEFHAEIVPEEGNYVIEAEGDYTELERYPSLSMNIKKGHIITHNDIEYKFVDASKVKATTISDVADIIGREASRNLAKGSLLSFSNVEEPVLIQKNEAVNAIYKVKNLEVKTVAIALQDGKEGDIIRLKNHQSDKIFSAMVDKDGNAITNFESLSNKNIAFDNNKTNKQYN